MRMALLLPIASAAVLASGTAVAELPKLKGTYAMTGIGHCLSAPGASGTPTNPTPGVMLPNAGFDSSNRPLAGHSYGLSVNTLGTITFSANGTATITARNLTITPPPTPGPLASAGYPSFAPGVTGSSVTSTLTYTLDGNGGFTMQSVPGTTTGSVQSGARAGQTFAVNSSHVWSGLIGKGGKQIVMATSLPYLDVLSYSNGDVWPRMCNATRTLIQLDD